MMITARRLLQKNEVIHQHLKWIHRRTLFSLSRSPSLLSQRYLYAETRVSNNLSYEFKSIHNRETRRTVHTLPGVSPREMAALEDRVWQAVGTKVHDPMLKKDLKTLEWMNRRLAISKDGTVQILLKMPTLLHPSLDAIKSQVQQAAEEEIRKWSLEKGLELQVKANVEVIPSKPLPWMANTPEDLDDIDSRLGPGLANVAHFLAVYSCKGGVGKSTIAVNLAYELARKGGRVGLLDVDVYGPSLPVLVRPDDPEVRQSPLRSGMVYPIEHKGVKLLSLGYVSPQSGVPGSGSEGGAAVMRGPMAGKVVAQLLKGTDWGELDVLILDLPPGTGDVQLTVCQDLNLSGAVAVTTPSKLAIADARKGIEMFSSLGVPTLAVVENMSYFECEGGGKHFPFGKGFQDFVKQDKGHLDINLDNVCQFPLSTLANDANDDGVPLCLTRPEKGTNELAAFEQLANIVSKELYMLPYRRAENQQQVVFKESRETFDVISLQLSLDQDEERPFVVRIFSENGAMQIRVAPAELRGRDPKTGDKLDSGDAPKESTSNDHNGDGMISIHRSTGSKKISIPQAIEKKGKYGYSVVWGDGAKIIYSMLAVAKAAGGNLQQ